MHCPRTEHPICNTIPQLLNETDSEYGSSDDSDDEPRKRKKKKKKRREERRGEGTALSTLISPATSGKSSKSRNSHGRENKKHDSSKREKRRGDPSMPSSTPTVLGRCHFKDTIILDHSRHYSAISAKGKEYLLHPSTLALKNCPLISNMEMKTLEQNFHSSFNDIPKELRDCSAWER